MKNIYIDIFYPWKFSGQEYSLHFLLEAVPVHAIQTIGKPLTRLRMFLEERQRHIDNFIDFVLFAGSGWSTRIAVPASRHG